MGRCHVVGAAVIDGSGRYPVAVDVTVEDGLEQMIQTLAFAEEAGMWIGPGSGQLFANPADAVLVMHAGRVVKDL